MLHDFPYSLRIGFNWEELAAVRSDRSDIMDSTTCRIHVALWVLFPVVVRMSYRCVCYVSASFSIRASVPAPSFAVSKAAIAGRSVSNFKMPAS